MKLAPATSGHVPAASDPQTVTSSPRFAESRGSESSVRRGASQLKVIVIDRFEDLASRESHLDDLADAATEANAFYEPYLLFPAIETFGRGERLQFVLIYLDRARQEPLLCGLFPLHFQSSYRGSGFGFISLWNYLHFNTCTPLLRAGVERETLGTFLQWAAEQDNRYSLLELSCIAGEGELHHALIDTLIGQDVTFYVSDV